MTINKYFYFTTVTYLLVFLSPLLNQGGFLSDPQQIALTTGFYLLGALLLLVYALRLQEVPLLERQPNSGGLVIFSWGIGGIFLAFAVQIIALLLEKFLFAIPAGSANTQNIIELVHHYPLYILAVSVGGPIMEELVFRRSLIAVLSQKIRPLYAALISAFAFAVAHQDGHLLLYFALGMTFYFLYQRTGRIWTSMLSHCLMNLLVILINLR